MGEYADMMLDGTCCSQCGEFMDIDGLVSGSFEAQGFPGLCSNCAREERRQPSVPRFNPHKVRKAEKQRPGDAIRQGDRMCCPFCTAKPKVTGFGDHMISQHRDKWPDAAKLI